MRETRYIEVRPFRYQVILIVALVIGAVVLQILINSHTRALEKENKEKLIKIHSDAMLRSKAGIDVYAALVSSLRSHIKNSPELPTEENLQKFLNDLIEDLEFNDSIVVSYLNTNHVFEYVFTPTKIDIAKLKGSNVSDFRPEKEIEKLNNLMKSDEILLFEPINLQEGWAGFPFNFSVKDSNKKSIGYFAPIINVKYLLNYFYSLDEDEIVHYFKCNDNFFISREVVYDGTEIFNTNRDNEYFKNFNINDDNFISSNLNLFGLEIEVGSAYKNPPEVNSYLTLVSYIWYIALIGFSILTLIQFVKNKRLTEKLKIANFYIEEKNKKLEKSISHVQTLIKEIHHRIKNNMLMINGLIDMQSEEYNDPMVKKALDQSKNRIQTMSLIHEKLYGSTNLEDLNALDYINQLIDFIEQTFKNRDIEIKKELKISSDIHFDGETMVPLGLILNELITNSYKYGFSANHLNILEVELIKYENEFLLTYLDNGPGIPDEFDITKSSSMGLQLVYLLTEELHGSVEYEKNGFSIFKIKFRPKFKSEAII